jgi:hypothetical protein
MRLEQDMVAYSLCEFGGGEEGAARPGIYSQARVRWISPVSRNGPIKMK